MDPSASSPILDALSCESRARLLDRAVTRRLRPGERLYIAGDRFIRAHFLDAGVMKLTAGDKDGNETILCLALPGELVGDVAAGDGLAQPLDAVAVTGCEVTGVEGELLREVLVASPQATAELWRLMARRARWIGGAAAERASGGVPARMAGRLLDLAGLLGRVERGAIEVELPVAQGDLGSLAGMCRESACKTLRAFKAAGLLDYRGRRIRILRPDALELIRCSPVGSAANKSR